MSETLFLLDGWGLGGVVAEALGRCNAEGCPRIERVPLPLLDSERPEDWLMALDRQLPMDVWLGGWSLGGMLATALAARRGGACPGLITLASNACFVARPDWTEAMPVSLFESFRHSCIQAPAATLKRFALLCTQGAENSRGLAKALSAAAVDPGGQQLAAGLVVLGALDNRAALQCYRGAQLHLFGQRDALLPVAASQAVERFGNVRTAVIEQGCHAFPCQQPQRVLRMLAGFMREGRCD